MLSRIAESLYWIGRACERAEDTARLLDVHYHVLLEDRWADEAAACRVLLDVMGVDADALELEPNPQTVTELLAYDRDFPGSIARAITEAWNNARGARESISSEMWEVLNSTHTDLGRHIGRPSGPARHDFFLWVKERTTMLSGLADSTLSRDDGWRFFVIGRNLERADMTTRLLSARPGDAWGPMGWTTTLRCASAYEAYLRTYRRAVDASTALEFLLLDRLFPRSVFFSLDTVERALAELDPRAGRVGVDDEVRRRVGRAVAELEFLRIDDVVADLPTTLARLQSGLAQIHEALNRRYFREARAVEWSV
ncbi:MAG: hypothetical protein JWL73_114 [Actinomycetia bacterium]|nr:hypothetical protein [Actinomycetes bacterium]